ncbi:hypothetical protein LEP1GSC158_1696 [Leptospira interrogans serovar Zanoni str. LT2156]|uniref:Uncharacterized protein n=1 Tax=Leptospira interrogans serovar Zanoni str. LT2156 TaxID=1001601 RepID=M6HD68_LEPIR|nr:hypothetical protein LEP1GSC158_1696 [Leptospira interrogans serovar Zanoni str. LT2156]
MGWIFFQNVGTITNLDFALKPLKCGTITNLDFTVKFLKCGNYYKSRFHS